MRILAAALSTFLLAACNPVAQLEGGEDQIARYQQAYSAGDIDALYRLTEPTLRPIRRILPQVGGIDLSPIVLILLIAFARRLLWEYFA